MVAAALALIAAALPCRNDEALVFSCSIFRDTRTVSLCLRGDRLSYRFGKPGAIQLEYPSTSMPAVDAFQRTQADLPALSDQQLAFHRRGVWYVIHHVVKRDLGVGSTTEQATLHVDRHGKRLAHHRCDGPIEAAWKLLDGKPFQAVGQ